MKNIIILILVFITFENLYSEIGEDKYILNPTIGFHLGGAYPIRTTGFSDVYEMISKKSSKGFNTQFVPSISYNLELNNQYRFGALVGFYKNEYYDYFYETIQTINGKKTKEFEEKFSIQYLPVILTCEIIPFKNQFRSFIGFGLGGVFSYINWQEKVTPIIEGDSRIGGQHFQKKEFNPALKFNCGVEFGFDENKFKYFLQCIDFQFFAYYIYKQDRMFSELNKQILIKNNSFEDTYSLIPGFFGISMGVLINTKGL